MTKFYADDDTRHQRALNLIDNSIQAYDSWDENAFRRRRYREGDQWTEEERKIIEDRKEPVITDNLIHDKVTALQGMELQMRTDPRAYPRNPGDDEGANAATNALRYIEEVNRLDQSFTQCGEYLAVEGTAAIECVIDKKSDPGAPDIVCKPLHYDRLILDPHSRELDFSDSRFIGYRKWMDRKEAIEEWGEATAKKLAAYEDWLSTSSQDDNREEWWYDKKRDRVRVVYLWYKEKGTIYQCELQRFGFVTEPVESPYRDDKGRKIWPIIARSAYVKSSNERYGEVDRFLDPQDEVNKRRSKSLHMLNTTNTTFEDGAFEDVDHAREEIKRPDNMVEVNAGFIDKIRIDRNLDLSVGHMNLLQLALSRFEQIGPNAALTGNESASGRSIQMQQQAGAARLGPHFDALDDIKIRTYRMCWHLVKQFWTDEKWIRIQGDDSRPQQKFIGLNQKVVNPQTKRVEIINPVADIDVDIIIAAQPDMITLRSEQSEQLFKLAQAGLIPPKFAIMSSDLKNKDEILAEMNGQTDDPEAQAAAQLQQQVQKMQLQMQQLEIAMKGAQVSKLAAETKVKEAEVAETLANTAKLEADTGKTSIDTARAFHAAD